MTEEKRNEIIAKMKGEHGRVVSLYAPENGDDPEIFVIAKRPPRGEWKRFRAALFDEAQKPDALEQLAKSCVVYPSKEEFSKILDDEPGLAEKLGSKIADAAGGDREFEAKKH